MHTIEIVVIGTNKPIMQTIARLIDQNEEWKAKLAYSVTEALNICLQESIKLVLIGAGITEEEIDRLKLELANQRPHLPIIKHYGGGSGLLFAEIHQGLGS